LIAHRTSPSIVLFVYCDSVARLFNAWLEMWRKALKQMPEVL
jgi:hypothetical protein